MKNSVKNILANATKLLAERNIDSPRLDAEILLAHVLGWRRLNLYIDDEKNLSLESILRFNNLITRRLRKSFGKCRRFFCFAKFSRRSFVRG